MAQQMNTAFPQPLIQGSGIGNAPGFPAMPVRAPGPGQGAVRKDFPPTLFIFNLSVPGFRVEDAVGRRPGAPVIQQYDMQQTVTNLILGYPSLILHNKPLWTQLEYAKQMNPTFALVELGYYDVLEAAGDTIDDREPVGSIQRRACVALPGDLRGQNLEIVH